MAYCAWCRKWGRTPVVKLEQPMHVALGDGVDIVSAIGLNPVAAGKTICARHQTLTLDQAKERFRK